MAVLYGFLEYSAGYNDQRVPVVVFARNMWRLDDWQHCFLVPIASLGLVYLNRKKLATLPVRGAWIGIVPILLGLFIFWFGYQADIIYFGYASAMITLAGLIIFLLGWQWMVALAFPWFFLVFMWPLLFLDNYLAFPLRGVMSKASVFALNTVGVPCMLSGTAILSAPDSLVGRPMGALFSVDVAEACSGIRSLFALMMISALYSYFSVEGWWKKCIIFLSSAPLAVLGNLCRIIMLTFGTLAFGSEFAIGKTVDGVEQASVFHMFAGYLVFVVAIIGMVGLAKLLNLDWSSLFHRITRPRPPQAGQGVPAAATPGGEYRDVY